jgi:DNA-binding transcriptional ArsR family regulator
MKEVKAISDPEACRLLADEKRRKIIYLLRAKEMTVSQIADELNLAPQNLYHHIKKMLEADLVEVTREVRVGSLIESYYRATAEVFQITVGQTSGSKELQTANIAAILESLKKIGFNITYNEKDIAKLSELTMKLDNNPVPEEYDAAISNLKDIDLLVKQGLQEYTVILSMSEEQLKRQNTLKQEFQNTLRSLANK